MLASHIHKRKGSQRNAEFEVEEEGGGGVFISIVSLTFRQSNVGISLSRLVLLIFVCTEETLISCQYPSHRNVLRYNFDVLDVTENLAAVDYIPMYSIGAMRRLIIHGNTLNKVTAYSIYRTECLIM